MTGKTVLDWLRDSFPEITPGNFYRFIFPAGELATATERTTGKYRGIVVEVGHRLREDGTPERKRYFLNDDLEAVERAANTDNFCLCSPLSYAGKNRTAENARMMYAMAIDLDRIIMEPDNRTGEPLGLKRLYHQIYHEDKRHGLPRLPKPTFMVGSGTGLHLYYVLESPVPLYRDMARELQLLKRELTSMIWHGFITDIQNDKDIQQEGIYQGFRMPGTVTKNGGRAKAYLTGERVTIEYLNGFVSEPHRAKMAEQSRHTGKMTIAEAKAKFPEWFEKRIVRKEKPGTWANNRKLYEWWKLEISRKATVGHRYYCLMTLAMYARKCSVYDKKHNPNPVTYEELEKDCYSLLEHMESLTETEDNHFTTEDIQVALEAFNDKWTRYPRAAIEYRSGITIPANKRNGRKRETHLKIARNTLEILNEENGKAKQGRKSKYEIIQSWRQDNPEGNITDCMAETGISKATVYRHWKTINETATAAAARRQQEEQERRIAEAEKALQKQAKQMQENMAILKESIRNMEAELEKMPDGKGKEQYQKQIQKTAENLKMWQVMMNPPKPEE